MRSNCFWPKTFFGAFKKPIHTPPPPTFLFEISYSPVFLPRVFLTQSKHFSFHHEIMAKIIPLSKLFALLGSTILPPPMQQHQSEAHFRASFMILCLSLFTLLQFVTAMLCVMLCSIMFHLHTKKPANCNFGAVGTTSPVILWAVVCKKNCVGKTFCMMQNVMRDVTGST